MAGYAKPSLITHGIFCLLSNNIITQCLKIASYHLFFGSDALCKKKNMIFIGFYAKILELFIHFLKHYWLGTKYCYRCFLLRIVA